MMGYSDTNEFNSHYFTKIPKVELHAHLNGSLSQSTLKKLIALKKQKTYSEELDLRIPTLSSNDLADCFNTFNLIHKITDNPEAIYLATCDVITEFYEDGVLYLELRTTPKDIGLSMTQEIYVETVLKAINDTCSQIDRDIIVKLLLSIDRKRQFTDAEKTLKTAEKFFISSDTVVGIDFSGDPTIGNVQTFLPLLESAKRTGLKLAVHIAEVPNKSDEVQCFLNLLPDRLGHGTYLHPICSGSDKNFDLCKKLQIPLEICLTSNVISKTVPSYSDHHFKFFREMDYPCILCTDDKGIFNTSLSNEYYLAQKYFSLSREDLFNLSLNSINYIFSPATVKKKLVEIWNKKKHLL